MPSRQPHKKSRFGCSQCKSRKVKCDEVGPPCTRCLRAGIDCGYLAYGPLARAPRAASTAQPTFDLLDLTLMNHFTAVTSLNLFSGENQQTLWQRDIPFEARSYPLLMHGLLSVASLHLALLEPKQELAYRIRALHHHNLGLQLFNSQICHLSSENSHALFGFALMLVIWVYASPEKDMEAFRLDDILDLLDLVRGCKAVFFLQKGPILGSRIGNFIEPEQWKNRLQPEPELSSAVQQAFQHLRTKAVDAIYIPAVDDLEKLVKRSITAPNNVKVGVAWPAIVADTYWIRLRSHEPIAILIFAYYAMILQRYENRWWWMTGWSERIIKALSDALQDTYKAFLGWDLCLGYIQSHRQDLACQQLYGIGVSG